MMVRLLGEKFNESRGAVVEIVDVDPKATQGTIWAAKSEDHLVGLRVVLSADVAVGHLFFRDWGATLP